MREETVTCDICDEKANPHHYLTKMHKASLNTAARIYSFDICDSCLSKGKASFKTTWEKICDGLLKPSAF